MRLKCKFNGIIRVVQLIEKESFVIYNKTNLHVQCVYTNTAMYFQIKVN